MKLRILLLAAFFAGPLTATPLAAQAPAQPDYQLTGTALSPAPPDPAIEAALAQISPERIRGIIAALVGFNNRSTLSSMETDLKPGTGATAAADWIAGQFEAISQDCNGCLEVKRDTYTQEVARRVARPTTLTNVYAILRGSDPASPAAAKRMYLVTGHYDSRNSKNENDHDAAPGANDDASGVAVSLECARVLSKLHLAATLVFVAVAGEEQGLYGSAHLAHLAKTEGWQLEGVLNNDIVGGNTTPGDALQLKDRVRVFSEGVSSAAKEAGAPAGLGEVHDMNDAPSRQLARAIAETARTYFAAGDAAFTPFLVARPDRYLRGGDHTSFNREGFAAVRLTEWREDFNHQHQDVRVEGGVQFGDLPEFVDYAYVAKVARLNAAALATLAASPGAPTEVKIVAENLENGTTLSWKPPLSPTANIRYELVWRETDAPDWQRGMVIPATDEGPVTVNLPVSKDNVIFGVRSVSTIHRGIVVTP